MMLGSLRLLYAVSKTEICSVFWKCLGRHHAAPLLIQRWLRIIAREVIGTPDGVALGRYARPVLSTLLSRMYEDPIPSVAAGAFLKIKPFRQTRTPYDEDYGDMPSLEGDSESEHGDRE